MSPSHKRPLEDFFKPYGRSNATIPQKRSSPSSVENEGPAVTKRAAPKTPGKTVTFKAVTPKSVKRPFFSPLSQSLLPIRSPRPDQVSPPRNEAQAIPCPGLPQFSPLDVKPNTSFTFSDVSDRSQKVFKEGKVVAVKDSDDDTDSLESLEDIIGRKSHITAESDSSPPDDTEAERLKAVSAFTSRRSGPIIGKDKLRAFYAKERAIKFDLTGIMDDHFGDEETQQNISKMRAGFAEIEDQDEDDALDKNLLASVVRTGDTDQEDVERLINAVERTEALTTEKKYCFFTTSGTTKSKSACRENFPVSAIPDELWTPNTPGARNQAYLSGYMSELAASGDLADGALKWTFNQVLREKRAELREAYIQCLKANSKAWTRLNVTAADVQDVFHILGARTDALRDASSIEPRYQPIQEQQKNEHVNLLSILQMFREICSDMDFLALSKFCSIVLRLALDEAIMSNSSVCSEVERVIETLLNLADEEARAHVYVRLLTDAKQHLHHPQLQIQLLNHIQSTSPEAIELRKTLADFFLFDSSSQNASVSQSPATFEELSKLVETSSTFSLTRHANSPATDYSALTARTQILSVAISSGSQSDNVIFFNTSPSKTALKKTSTEETQFNSSVDHLADQLHNLFSSIKDTGASHMRRTEAKDALQALYFRLLFSVRTKARKKRHVFDPNGELKAGNPKARWVTGEEFRDKERAEQFMKKFFLKQEVGGV